MTSNPQESSNYSPLPIKEALTKRTDQSLIGEPRTQTFVTERRETNDDVQSFVIVNDIDVEEELNKAQKDNQNYFKLLSMSFYGKVKSHSLDRQEYRDNQQSQGQQVPLTALLPRKKSLQTPKSNHISHNQGLQKLKTQERLKKPIPIKDFQLHPVPQRKRLMSPKEESSKAGSPTKAGSKYQMGNFASSPLTKKETTFFLESQLRPSNKKRYKNNEPNENRATSPGLKANFTGRSNSPAVEFKKTSPFKSAPGNKKTLKLSLERTKPLEIEKSGFDVKMNERENKEREGDKSRETSIKGSRVSSKQSSRRNSKGKEKSSGNETNSGRSLYSVTTSQLRSSLRESLEAKISLFEQDSRMNNLFMRDKSLDKEIKKLSLKREKKATKNKEKKSGGTTQATKKTISSSEKIQKIGCIELRTSYNQEIGRGDESNEGKEGEARSKEKEKDSETSGKSEQEKFSLASQIFERIPSMGMSGIGNWGIKSVFLARENSTTKKNKQKEREKITNEFIDLKTFKMFGKSAGNSKTNSVERIERQEVIRKTKPKKKVRNESQKELDADLLLSKPDLVGPHNEKITEKEDKSKTKVRTRPTSPLSPPIDVRKSYEAHDNLFFNKRTIKENL